MADEQDASEKLKEGENVEQGEGEVSLKRTVGIPGGVAFLVGSIIGSGIFATPKWVFINTGSVGMSLVVWTLCGLISLLSSLCYIELGTLIPKSGGEYAYLSEAFGPLAGFMVSWVFVLFIKPAGAIMILLIFASYAIEPFYPGCSDREDLIPIVKLLAVAALGVITFVNCFSVKMATRMHIFFTIAKMVAIVMVIVTGLVRLGQGYTTHFENAFAGTKKDIGTVGFAFLSGLFAYDGWNQLNLCTEELKKPRRDLPVSICIAIPLITACYVLVNIGYFTVLSPDELVESRAVAGTLANQLYGVMSWTIPVLVACSTFGAANGMIFGGGRLLFASAREGHMPSFLAMIHVKRSTPLPAVIFSSIISCIMILPDSSNFGTLLNYFSFINWLTYGSALLSVVWLRFRRPNAERPFKIWLPIPCLMVLMSLYLIAAPFLVEPLGSLYCLLFVLASIPAYFLFARRMLIPAGFFDFIDRVTYKLQQICGVAFPTPEVDKYAEDVAL